MKNFHQITSHPLQIDDSSCKTKAIAAIGTPQLLTLQGQARVLHKQLPQGQAAGF